MNIVGILGSPRKDSNSSIVVREILEIARTRGATAEEFLLNQMSFKGCQACDLCKKAIDYCPVNDDLAPLLEKTRQADVVVMGTPVYFGEVSGQFKSFFDRTYSFLDPDFAGRLTGNRKSVFVIAQGQEGEEVYQDIYPRYQYWLREYGFAENHLIRITGCNDAGGVRQMAPIMQMARDVADTLMK